MLTGYVKRVHKSGSPAFVVEIARKGSVQIVRNGRGGELIDVYMIVKVTMIVETSICHKSICDI